MECVECCLFPLSATASFRRKSLSRCDSITHLLAMNSAEALADQVEREFAILIQWHILKSLSTIVLFAYSLFYSNVIQFDIVS